MSVILHQGKSITEHRAHVTLVDIQRAMDLPPIRSTAFIDEIPFGPGDITVGSESELQAAVLGSKNNVDLPVIIENSSYYDNIIRRASAGDISSEPITDLERYLEGDQERIWENSWVWLPVKSLCRKARLVLQEDLLADKSDPSQGKRCDQSAYWFIRDGQECLRTPISYLLKLALVDAVGCRAPLNQSASEAASRVMKHFLNDNTSPETFSFYIAPIEKKKGLGRPAAKEKALRFLLTQMLLTYANEKFELKDNGQTAMVYFSPHPPVRQKQLNEAISDSYYRSLFMSPCLSGWDKGEAKHAYMCLCHRILSASQLNAVAKMKDAGIITRNLIVLPTLSNISLANNGVHISMGSAKLSKMMADKDSGFGPAHEKYLGDLVIKIIEHFIPLFVNTYSAAPYRIGFEDFHPEKILAFLPHQLDFTHLRMIWRRWKKKAHLRVFGQPLTPFGWRVLDKSIARTFRLKGDYIPDFRLMDYPVALMSTPNSPALDGRLGNQDKLKYDLTHLGVFDQNMALYSLYRLREYRSMGFSGFEARHYSLFESLKDDMTLATNLQALITAFAYKLALQGMVRHEHIPDDPYHESERRQAIFGAAIDIPTFFTHGESQNKLLNEIVARTWGARYSRRYSGYKRIYNHSFKLALVEYLEDNAQDLIEMFDMKPTMEDLRRRLVKPELHSAEGKLTKGILEQCSAKNPLDVEAEEFNTAAETYYRNTLKRSYLIEALEFANEELLHLEKRAANGCHECRQALKHTLGDKLPSEFVKSTGNGLINETLNLDQAIKWIDLILLSTKYPSFAQDNIYQHKEATDDDSASIRRAGNWRDDNRESHRRQSAGVTL